MCVKKSQVSVYLIIGLVLILLLALFYNYANKEKSDRIEVNNNDYDLKPFVDSCLEVTTLDGISLYGLSKNISRHIDSEILNCLSNFSDFNEEINFGIPKTVVEISNESIIVELQLDIKTSTRKYDYFYLNLPKLSSISGENGGILTSVDKNFQLIIKKQNANATMEKLDKLGIKIADSSKYGPLVVNSVVYYATPDNIHFGPPLTAVIRLKKDRLNRINPAGIKVSWFDDNLKIWKPYKDQNMKEDQNYYYFSASIDHFTPIALVSCGYGSGYGFEFDLGTLYKQPIEPALEPFWIKGEDYAYLIPELSAIASCNLFADNYYSVEEKIKREELCDLKNENSLIRDWDNDDSKDKVYDYEDYELIMIKDGERIRLTKDNTLLDFSFYEDSCLKSCREVAAKELLNYFYGENHDTGLAKSTIPMNLRYDNRYELVDYVSGDGINDNALIKCDFNYDTEINGKYNANYPRCVIDNNNLINKKELIVPTLTEEENHKIQPTLDYLEGLEINYEELPKETMGDGFFATPRTYGYYNLIDSVVNPGDLDGIGRYYFNLEENICIDSTNYGEDIRIYEEATTEKTDLDSYQMSIIDSLNPNICSQGDNCILTLNEQSLFDEEVLPGKLKSNKNVLSVYVKNNRENMDLGIGLNAFFKGRLFVKGNIISQDAGQDMPSDVNCMGNKMILDYPNNMQYELLCPDSFTCIYIEEDADRLIFDTISGNNKRVGCRPICTQSGNGLQSSCEWAGLTSQRDIVGECKFNQDFCIFERGYPTWGYKKKISCIDKERLTLLNHVPYTRLETEEIVSTTDGTTICT